jgi:hypothetical protein
VVPSYDEHGIRAEQLGQCDPPGVTVSGFR